MGGHRLRSTTRAFCSVLAVVLGTACLVSHAYAEDEPDSAPATTLSGVVVDEAGKPLAGLDLQLVRRTREGELKTPPTLTRPPWYVQGHSNPSPRRVEALLGRARSDPSGRFEFPSPDNLNHAQVRIVESQRFAGTLAVWGAQGQPVRLVAVAAKPTQIVVLAPPSMGDGIVASIRATGPYALGSLFTSPIVPVTKRDAPDATRALTFTATLPRDGGDLRLGIWGSAGGVFGIKLPAADEEGRIHVDATGDERLRLRVTNRSGAPIASAEAQASFTWASSQNPHPVPQDNALIRINATSDADGYVVLQGLPAHTVLTKLQIKGEAYATLERIGTIPLAHADDQALPCVLEPARRLTVRVKDDADRPIQGAYAVVSPLDGPPIPILRRKSTSALGTCTFSDLPAGQVKIQVWARGHIKVERPRPPQPSAPGRASGWRPPSPLPPWYEPVVDLQQASTSEDVVLHRANRITGTVRDEAGVAVPHLYVSLGTSQYGRTHLPHVEPTSYSAYTDTDGRFSIEGLPPMRSFTLTGGTPRYPIEKAAHVGKPLGYAQDLDVRVQSRRELRVAVRTPGGTPVVGAKVRCWNAETGAALGTGEVSKLGAAQIWAPPSTALRITAPLAETTVSIPAGTDAVDRVLFTASASKPQSILVRDAAGQVRAGLAVRLIPKGHNPFASLGPVLTNQEGIAVFPAVLQGAYMVQAAQASREVTLPGEDLTITLRSFIPTFPGHLATMYRAYGRVLGPDGTPVSRGRGYLVFGGISNPLRGGHVELGPALTLFEGWTVTSVMDLPPEQMHLRLTEARDARGAALPIVTEDHPVVLKDGRFTVRLRAAARLTCRVIDEEGEPVTGVTVTADAEGPARRGLRSRWDAVSDARGLARFERLIPGRSVVIYVAAPSGYVKPEITHVAADSVRTGVPNEVTVTLNKPRIQMIRVVDPEGNALEGITLEVRHRGALPSTTAPEIIEQRGTQAFVTTNGEGIARVEGLPPVGALVIQYPARRHSGGDYVAVRRVLEAPVRDPVLIKLVPLATFRVRVVTPWGEPVSQAAVTLTPWWYEDQVGVRRHINGKLEDGAVNFTRLPPGEYVVTVHNRSSRSRTQQQPIKKRVRIPASGDLVIELAPLTRWEPLVRLPDGQRLIHAVLFMDQQSGARAGVLAGRISRERMAEGQRVSFHSITARTGTLAIWTRDAAQNIHVALLAEVDFTHGSVDVSPKPSMVVEMHYADTLTKKLAQHAKLYLQRGSFWVQLGRSSHGLHGVPAGTYDVVVEYDRERMRGTLQAPAQFDTEAGEPLTLTYVPPDSAESTDR